MVNACRQKLQRIVGILVGTYGKELKKRELKKAKKIMGNDRGRRKTDVQELHGHVEGASKGVNFLNAFDVVYMESNCFLLLRGSRAIRESQLFFRDSAYPREKWLVALFLGMN
ncbi:unnamed protein product [Linum trigynum]|uniref:Uncharacterized protein n=1 Tax=Linum trigynum TaxID=586398 RepID=A0AAV2G9X6_9ROSI